MFHLVQLPQMAYIITVLQRELRPGQHKAGFGKCYICNEMTEVPVVNDKYQPYFVLDEKGNKQFVGRDCYSSILKLDLERVPNKG